MRLPCGKSHRNAVGALALAAFACAVITAVPAQKNKEEETQTLQLPRELPAAAEGETRRLAFHVTPLSAKGLLSQQVRDAMKALGRQTRGETVLHIRAFVAGTGDLRRVRDLVSETFTNRHQPLPALSLVRVGGLALTGAQVAVESVAAARKNVNPGGLAFLSPRPAVSGDPLDPVPPLTARALAGLRQEVRAAGAQPSDVLQVTCYFSSLENLAASRALVEAEYPRAALGYVQTQRAPVQALAACEAVARLQRDPGVKLRLLNARDLPAEPGESQIALVGAPRLVLTGTQVSFGYQEKDARLAFERIRTSLQQAGTSERETAYARYYPLAPALAVQVRALRAAYFDASHTPAGFVLLFEGLPSLDSGFAVDVAAVKE